MKQLSINVAKNVTINDLVCTPNVIVLAKQSTTTNVKTGETTTSVRYIEVCKVEKTESLAIVQSVLKYIVAEFLVCNDLEKDFADTNIKQRKLFNQFLSGNIIYRTNTEGKIANALVSEVPLRQTALNVKDYHAIATCKPENRKAAIYQHAKAIRAQCAYISLIKDKAETLESEQTETTVKTDKPAQNKRKTVSAPSFAPAPAAMVAAPAQ